MQQFLSKLKIQTKLLVGFSVLLTILLLASSLIRLRLTDVRGEVDRLLHDQRPVEQLALELDRKLDDVFDSLGTFAAIHDEKSARRYRTAFAQVKRTLAQLERTPGAGSSPQAVAFLNSILRQLDALQQYDTQLLATSDDEINYPGMAYAKTHLYPIGLEMQQLTSQLLHTDESLPDRDEYELLLLKTDLRYYWTSVMSSIRAYIAYRNESLREDSQIFLDAVHRTLEKMETGQFDLDLEEQTALQQCKDALLLFKARWHELQSIHGGERWRTDRYLMRKHIVPLHSAMGDDLESFIGLQRQTMDMLSDQLVEKSSRISNLADLFLILSMITGIGIALTISRVIARPIHKITTAMEEIAGGEADLTRRLNVSGNDEIARLAQSFNSFALKAQHRAEEEHALSELLRLSLNQSQLETYLQQALESIIQTVTWLSLIPKGAIYLCPADQCNELELTATYNFSVGQMQSCANIPFGECLCGQAAQSREIVFTDHSEQQYAHYRVETHDETHTHSHCFVPIRSGDAPLGLMTLYLPQGYTHSSNQEAFLYKVAEVLSIGISLRQANQQLLIAKQEAESISEQLTSITANIPGIIYQCRISADGSFEYPFVGPGTGMLLGKLTDDSRNDMQRLFDDVHEQDRARLKQVLETSYKYLQPINLEYRIKQQAGGPRWILCNALPRRTKDGDPIWDGILLDITDRKNLESKLLQAQKLESVGQLAAGIAHEINTPTQYVQDNTRFLNDAFEDYAKALGAFRQLRLQLAETSVPRVLLEQVDAVCKAVDTDYLEQEIPHAISQSLDGLKRISTIVSAMKEFSHPGTDMQQPVDVNAVIKNLVTVTRNEWKYVADLEMTLGNNLPSPMGFRDKLGQVILNIIVNAAHAIADHIAAGKFDKGRIGITTRCRNDAIEIRVSDNGPGIPLEIQEKIFDPFFTTKEVGKGTGQGLSIAHSVIVELHRGNLAVESAPGEGASFIIQLPVPAKSLNIAANDQY